MTSEMILANGFMNLAAHGTSNAEAPFTEACNIEEPYQKKARAFLTHKGDVKMHIKAKTILSILMVICLNILLICPADAKDQSKTVMAQGVAAIQGNNIEGARAAAVENALRNAIEQGLGTMMDAKALVKNDQLLEQIYTHTKGYVPEYEVIREKKAEGGLYRVTISAVVKTAALKNRLAQLGIIKQMMAYPRLVIIPENANGRAEAVKSAGQVMAGFFTDKRFDVVSGEAVDTANRTGDATGTDPAAIGRARHAEIVVVYALSAESSKFDGVMETVPVSLSARAIVTSTGQVLSSEQARAHGLGNSAHAALMDGARKVVEQLSTSLSEDIVGWWAEYTANGLPYHMVLKTASGSARQVVDFQQKLQSIPGVTTLAERSSGQGTTRMRLTFKGRTTELKQQILSTIAGVDDIVTNGRYMELTFK